MHGLDMYDFHWRSYCPFTLRTTTQDPMQEMFPWISSYSWSLNNPVNVIDPDGRIAMPLIVPAVVVLGAGAAVGVMAHHNPDNMVAMGQIMSDGLRALPSSIRETATAAIAVTATMVANQLEGFIPTNERAPHPAEGMSTSRGDASNFPTNSGGDGGMQRDPKDKLGKIGGAIAGGALGTGITAGVIQELTNPNPSKPAHEAHLNRVQEQINPQQQSAPFRPQHGNNQQDKPIWQLW
jgi:hypothetical protein